MDEYSLSKDECTTSCFPSQGGKDLVSFEYVDSSANLVALVGDGNEWNPEAQPLTRDSGGKWTVNIRLARGNYQYKFVVNGERWEEDPSNQHRVANEHGTHNSIRQVGTDAKSTGQPSP